MPISFKLNTGRIDGSNKSIIWVEIKGEGLSFEFEYSDNSKSEKEIVHQVIDILYKKLEEDNK